MTEPKLYHAYLLRLWRAGNGDQPEWRVSVESASSGERHLFANLEGLFRFLERITAESPGSSVCTPTRDTRLVCPPLPGLTEPSVIEGESRHEALPPP